MGLFTHPFVDTLSVTVAGLGDGTRSFAAPVAVSTDGILVPFAQSALRWLKNPWSILCVNQSGCIGVFTYRDDSALFNALVTVSETAWRYCRCLWSGKKLNTLSLKKGFHIMKINWKY